MPDIPPALQWAADNVVRDHPGARALLEAPGLRDFWRRIADHAETMSAKSAFKQFPPEVLAGVLVACVTGPLERGHDARGTAARVIRGAVDMKRRRRAAALARELAALLREIEREPFSPMVAYDVGAWLDLPLPVASAANAALHENPPEEVLERLAAALERAPDFSNDPSPALASRKPSWRGYLREVVAYLSDFGFAIREVDAVRLVAVLCRAAGVMPPSRDAVRDALRAGRTPNPEPSHRCQQYQWVDGHAGQKWEDFPAKTRVK